MHMPVDQARSDHEAAQVVGLARLRERAARVHARDHRADDADVGFAHLQGRDVDDARAGEQQVERLLALGHVDGTIACWKMNSVVHRYSSLWLAAFTIASYFSISLARKAANSAGVLPTTRKLVSASLVCISGSLVAAAISV